MTGSEGIPPESAVLKGLAFFDFMPNEVRRLVMASFVPLSVPFGTVVTGEGDEADAFFVIASGRARVLKMAEGGQEIPLGVLGPGDSFGEMAMLCGGRRTATVRTSSAVDLLRLDAAVFRAMAAGDDRIVSAFELSIRRHALQDILQSPSSPFRKLSTDAITELLRHVVPVDLAPGDVVVRAGDPVEALYVVEEGRIRAYTHKASARCDVAYLRKGDVIGEQALLAGGNHPATFEAVSGGRVMRLPRSVIDQLLANNPTFRDRLSRRTAEYDFKRVARVPIDFTDEILPADVRPNGQCPDPSAATEETGLGSEAAGPFASGDGLFVKGTRRIRRFPRVLQIDDADCGAAALAMVCRHYHRPVSLAKAREVVNTGLDGSSLQGLARGAADLGLVARAIKASRRNLADMPLPAIIHWKGNHWVVLYDVTDDKVRVADPAYGLRRLPRRELDTKWSGYAVLLAPTDAPRTIEGAPSPAHSWLRSLVRRYWRSIAGASALAMAVSCLQLALPVFAKIVVDRVVGRRELDLLHVLVFAMAGVLSASVAASFFQRLILSRIAVRMDGETLDFVASRMLRLPMRYFYARRTGDIQRRLDGMRQARQFIVQNAVSLITSIAELAGILALMVVYSPVLALVFLAALPAYVGLMRIAVRRVRPLLDDLEESYGRYHGLQIDAIKGIETVKALGAEDALRRAMVREYAGLARRQYRADLATTTYDGAVQLVTLASLAAFLWVGALQVLNGALTVGGLVSFNALVVLAAIPVVTVMVLWNDLQYVSVLVGRLNDIFEAEPEQGDDHSHLRPVASLEGRVRVEGLGFRYRGPESTPILSDITFEVRPGALVAIVGRSGSGKTTLVKCLVGLVEPTEGAIYYDGAELRTLDYGELRRQIGFVSQENFLFADTLAANIGFGEEEPDMDRVRWAATVANAHEFIARLPLGYGTKVGETGLLLSGGQRQRVAIARAVYPRPPILIFDEATSSLDTESERAVQENLGRLLEGRTSFVIAHRLSTIRNADLILVLEKGRLVERGSHDELMAKQGLYFYLSSQQLAV
ncbi:MAG: peptidase domain-containing ABC transporter [Actinomycetota bacterium]|nr:peptidase domain-containing ABC transporter [Actinomycetota bacterium]